MRKHFARPIAILLLCLSLLSGMLLPALAVASPATTGEAVVLNVYEQTEGGEAKEVKTYTASELAALKTEGAVGYQYWKGGNEMLVAATEYVTMNSLLTDAGIPFANGDTLKAAASDGFTGSLTYADSETYRYYITADGKTEVPAALALTWGSGSGTLEEVAATAKNTGNLRFVYGISEQQYADKSAAGKRLVSGIASVTVLHKGECKHEQTEVKNAKAATCTEDGYTGDLYCTLCGALLQEGAPTPPLGHSYKDGKCTVCGVKAPPQYEDFKDLPANAWYKESVGYALANGLMNGTGDGIFQPDGALTRAMLVTILYRSAGEPSVDGLKNPFQDVADGQWYTKAVVWAADKGIVNGTSETTFDPDANITREQIAAILHRYAGKPETKGDLASFPDAATVSDYAKTAMAWTVEKGIIGGSDGKLDPRSNATRAQVAAILMRYLKLK